MSTQTFTTKLIRPTETSSINKSKPAIARRYGSSSSKLLRFIPKQEEEIVKELSPLFQKPSLKKNVLKKQSQESCRSQYHDKNEDNDLMLIDETIDLIGSDENVYRTNNINNKEFNDATFDLIRKKDATFIKTPTSGSMNNLICPSNEANQEIFAHDGSKSRDSLHGLPILSSTRTSKNWGSDEILNLSRASSYQILNNTTVLSSTLINDEVMKRNQAEQQLDVTDASEAGRTMLFCGEKRSQELQKRMVSINVKKLIK